MKKLVLVHWHPGEATLFRRELETLGWQVFCVDRSEKTRLKPIREFQPRLFLISLSRLPSHGQAFARAVWSTAWARNIPILFFDGSTETVTEYKRLFPDAYFCRRENIAVAIQKILEE
ncbi:MAG: hypothetical protein GXO78_07800 [Calditrichaeota bacterium]|nr:hypothetical protein [Calditrichota bacterium]